MPIKHIIIKPPQREPKENEMILWGNTVFWGALIESSWFHAVDLCDAAKENEIVSEVNIGV